MFRIDLLKCLDRSLGRALAHLLTRPTPHSASAPPSSILFIRPGGIGDAVHLIPDIQQLLARFPSATIDVVAERRNAEVFALCPGLGRVWHYDRPGELLKILRRRYDVVIDTEQWHRLSAIVARFVKSPIKIGYATNERARLFTHAIPYRHDDYEVESFLHLLGPLGINLEGVFKDAWLRVPESSREITCSLLSPFGEKRYVALFPGASIAERRWGGERFHAVAKWCGAHGLNVVVVGGGGDRNEAARIATGLEHVLDLAGRTSLTETAAILERSAVVVSGDSGVLHIAAALGRPTVSFFGPGIAAKWAPRGPRHIVLNKNLPCSPCTRFGTTPPCPHNVNCMREISVEEVTRAIRSLLLTHPSICQVSDHE